VGTGRGDHLTRTRGHSLVPTIARLDGAELIAIVSASPARASPPPPRTDAGGAARPASLARWERWRKGIAGEHGVYVALAQLVGFEGGKGFPGGSLVVDPGGMSWRGRRSSRSRSSR